MYTLRKVSEGIQYNTEIGSEYKIIDRHYYDVFYDAFKDVFGYNHVADLDSEATEDTKNCYMILVIKEGKEMIPLYKYESYYIMNENGKTFSNLSIK